VKTPKAKGTNHKKQQPFMENPKHQTSKSQKLAAEMPLIGIFLGFGVLGFGI
jgi:hypothetical protein